MISTMKVAASAALVGLLLGVTAGVSYQRNAQRADVADQLATQRKEDASALIESVTRDESVRADTSATAAAIANIKERAKAHEGPVVQLPIQTAQHPDADPASSVVLPVDPVIHPDLVGLLNAARRNQSVDSAGGGDAAKPTSSNTP